MRDVEISLLVDNIGHKGLAAVPLYKGHVVFIASVGTKNRKALPFLTPGETTRESLTFRRDYQEVYGVAPRVAMEIKSWGVVKRFAELGMGIGLIPDYLLRSD